LWEDEGEAIPNSPLNQGRHTTHMKKLFSIMLGMTLLFGVVEATFAAQDEPKKEEKKKKKKKKKEGEEKPPASN
jgi:hypothetical protein